MPTVEEQTLYVTEADIPGNTAPDVTDPAAEIETKVAMRPAEARAIIVSDQATLDAVGERLAVNKALQREAGDIFDPVITSAHEAHKKAIAAKKRVTDPLTSEEIILKAAAQRYLVEQRKAAEEAERVARQAREAEERRLIAIAEEKRRADEAELNARLAREHEEEIERVLNALPKNTPVEQIEAICAIPAPHPVSLPLDLPDPVQVAIGGGTFAVAPKGMSMARKYKAEVTSIAQLCRAVASGEVSVNYVTANVAALNARARADGAAMKIPGVRVVEDFSIRSK